MAAVILRQKDVERLGKELLKEVYEFLHDEYILNNFSEMKLEKQKLIEKLIFEEFRSINFTIQQKENSWKICYDDFDESKYEDEIKCLKDKVDNKSFNTSVIFNTLNNLKLDMEIEENLFYKVEGFLNIFKVFDGDYSYLED